MISASNLSSFNIRQGFDDDNQHVKTLFPDSWSDIFSRPDIIQILFKVCKIILKNIYTIKIRNILSKIIYLINIFVYLDM